MKIALLTSDNRDAYRRYGDPEPYFGPAPTALLQGFAMLGEQTEVPPFEIHVISCTQKPLKAPEKLASNIWYHSLHVPKIGWLRTGYLGCIRAVRRKIREIEPDIVHGQGTERDCAISAVYSGYPNVLTIHGNMAELALRFGAKPGGFHWLMGKLEDFTLPRAAGVFCNSDYTRSLVAPRACKTWRVDNPIRKEFFSAPAVNRQLEPPILLNIGVISPRKRQIELLDMAARIHKRGISLELRFLGPCGSEPYASDFRRMVAEAEKEGYATYGGNLEITKLVSEMERASGLCHFPTEEAFGLVVAEALSKDLKFFGSRVGGIPGIVEGVEDAELIEPEDFQSLEELIVGWATSGSRSAEGGQALMRNRFHPKTIASVHLEIYREVLNRSNE